MHVQNRNKIYSLSSTTHFSVTWVNLVNASKVRESCWVEWEKRLKTDYFIYDGKLAQLNNNGKKGQFGCLKVLISKSIWSVKSSCKSETFYFGCSNLDIFKVHLFNLNIVSLKTCGFSTYTHTYHARLCVLGHPPFKLKDPSMVQCLPYQPQLHNEDVCLSSKCAIEMVTFVEAQRLLYFWNQPTIWEE